MKKILIYMLLAALALSGCGQKQTAEKTTLQITVEGQTEEIPTAQYIGNGFSIDIPRGGLAAGRTGNGRWRAGDRVGEHRQ